MKRIDHYWYHLNILSVLLFPITLLFCLLVTLRRLLYRWHWLKSETFPVPVIVVGNISVGGTGKTPLVVALVEWLKQAGYHPGVISRGYRGQATAWPQAVDPQSDPLWVGDEAVLLAGRCQCPMVVGPERSASIQQLLAQHQCDVIVSDDGLQHYRMARAIEIAVVDGQRRFGNGLCLPSGPLREPISRLKSVDFVVVNGGQAEPSEYAMRLQSLLFHRVDAPTQVRDVAAFAGQRVHAIAGIGNPQRFFQHLSALGLDVVPHAFPDHHDFTSDDLQFEPCLPVIMTEKDAVKCRAFGSDQHWYLAVEGHLNTDFFTQLLTLLRNHPHGSKTD